MIDSFTFNFSVFKARLVSALVIKGEDRFYEPHFDFLFTKEIILLPKEILVDINKGKYNCWNFLTDKGKICNKDKYTLCRLPKYSDAWTKDSKFQIKFRDDFFVNLRINSWNTFKLNMIHNRYWLFNEKKWFLTFLLAVLSIILSLSTYFKSIKQAEPLKVILIDSSKIHH
jgi:hypothetical protein